GELEALLQDLVVAEAAEARQGGPDLRRDGIVTVTVPAQIELGLLAEVLEVGHGRSYGSCHVGGHGPFGRSRRALQQRDKDATHRPKLSMSGECVDAQRLAKAPAAIQPGAVLATP